MPLAAIASPAAEAALQAMQGEAARVSSIPDLEERRRALGRVSRLAIDAAEELAAVEQATRLAAIGRLIPAQH